MQDRLLDGTLLPSVGHHHHMHAQGQGGIRQLPW